MSATTNQPAKTQPWKAHYSPVNKEHMTANQNYLVDNNGSLLIDGCCAGALHSELACARKETKATYNVSEDGCLLVDGASDPGSGFSELACASKEGGKN